jgi:colanic acid/amylovoran biosynthesis glycosyltransferase
VTGSISVTAVVSRFPAPSQTFISRKLDALRDAGIRVEVASAHFHDGATESGYRLVPLAPWMHPAESFTGRGIRAWRSLARTVATGQLPPAAHLRDRLTLAPASTLTTDIVHFEFSGIAVSYLPVLDTLRRRSRIVVSCRGAAEQIEPIKDPRRAEALADVFGKVDLIHCVSDDMRRTVEALGVPTERIIVNRPAVPVADFAPLRERWRVNSTLRILSIGRLHWKKGIDDGLQAVARLRSRGIDVQYRIAGEGTEREKLTFLIDQLGLSDCVELLGSSSQDQVRSEIASADIIFLPSLSEGISNAVLEGMAAGRAVVTTDCGGMTEVIENGVDGVVVGIGDIGEMAEQLTRLAGDADLRSRLGAAAATTADRDLDISRQANVFVSAYRELLGR